jgi:hypothetical protein
MSKATEPNSTPASAEPIADGLMEGWEIGDVEPVLHKLKAEIAIFGHLLNTPDKVDPDTFAQLEDSLIESHAALVDRWHGSWRFEMQERNAAMAALEAAKAERAAPGSKADIQYAEMLWSMLAAVAGGIAEGQAKRNERRAAEGQSEEPVGAFEAATGFGAVA